MTKHNRGWHGEKQRHVLASKGIRTCPTCGAIREWNEGNIHVMLFDSKEAAESTIRKLHESGLNWRGGYAGNGKYELKVVEKEQQINSQVGYSEVLEEYARHALHGDWNFYNSNDFSEFLSDYYPEVDGTIRDNFVDTFKKQLKERKEKKIKHHPFGDLKPGIKVRAKMDIDWLYPFAYIEKGEVGTITHISENQMNVKMKKHYEGLDEWDNEAHLYDDFAKTRDIKDVAKYYKSVWEPVK